MVRSSNLSDADFSSISELAADALREVAARTGRDPYFDRLPVFALPSRALGGLSVDAEQRTSLEGLYAVGGASAAYVKERTHAGTALLSDLFCARAAAMALEAARTNELSTLDESASTDAEQRLVTRAERARSEDGESAFALRRELARGLAGGDEAFLDEFRDRLFRASCVDEMNAPSASLSLLMELDDLLLLGRAVVCAGHGSDVRVRCTAEGEVVRA